MPEHISEYTPDLEEEAQRPKLRLSHWLEEFMAGDGHIHTISSETAGEKQDALYSFEQVFDYVKKEVIGRGKRMEFVIFAEHPSDAGNPSLVDGQKLLEHQQVVHKFIKNHEEEGGEFPRLISGVEADIISADGDLDVPDEVLSKMDIVIASKHDLKRVFPDQGGNPDAEQLTHMYLALMDNPHVDVIGHPNRYVSYEMLEEMDWSAIFSKAKETKTALEINFKAPMTPELIIRMVKAGVPIFIGTDAHSLEEYQRLPEDAKIEIEEDRLDYPLGVKFSFWRRKVFPVLQALHAADAPPEQIITSSYKRLHEWLSKEKLERKIEFENGT